MSNPKSFSIAIAADGSSMTFVYDDDHAALFNAGSATVTRASHVEPAPGGGWTADMSPVGGPILGPFPLRSQALQAENDYLASILF